MTRIISLWLCFIPMAFGYSPATTSFNAGQVSPLMEARSDFQKYNSSCRTIENMLVLAQGPVTKRPGTKYIATAKYADKKCRLIPFQYSTDDTYIIEMGDFYMRFYRNGGQILSAGAPYEIVTPFSETEVFDVKYAQSNNIMYLVDGTDAPQKLTRAGHTSWTIANAEIDNGPFQKENTSTTTITPSATTGSITLTASSSIFKSGHVGSIWEVSQKRGVTSYDGDLALADTGTGELAGGTGDDYSPYFTGGYSFTTSGTWTGMVILQRCTGDPTVALNWESALAPLADTNFDNPSENEEDGAYYRVYSEIATGTCKYVFTLHDQLNHGVVEITAYTSGTSVTGTVITALENTTATTKWREGYWSNYRGWPNTVEFHQQRLIFGGSESFPQTIWFGENNPEDYEDFAEGTLDTSSFTIALQGQNPIQWIVSQSTIMIGTSGSIGVYGNANEAVTPTSPAYQENSKTGSSLIRANISGDTLIYVERGNRKVREMVFALQYDKYISPDLTILAEDITKSGIVDTAYQMRPNPVLWCALNNGNAATLTYYKDQEVVGWTKQITDGFFESFAVIPEEDEDEVWTVVKRTIGNSYVKYIEQFQPVEWGDDDDLCFFVDSGLSYSGASALSTFSGLSHLAGRTVSVYADGVVLSNETVSSTGTITIDNAAYNVVTGLPFTSKIETLPLFIDPQDKAMNKKINTVAIDFYKSGACKYGNGPSAELMDLKMYEDVSVEAEAGLYTSDTTFKRVLFPYGPKKKQTIYLESTQPVPLTIRSIVPEYDITP